MAYKHEGFWMSMETFKDKQHLDSMYSDGRATWQVWEHDD
jgi:glucose-1-phosphate cytidylyltransferase